MLIRKTTAARTRPSTSRSGTSRRTSVRVTRRDFIAQGFGSGLATVLAPTVFSLFANPRAATAALSPDLEALKASCGIDGAGRRQDPVHLLRPRRRRQHGRLERADRRAGRPARFPDHRRLRQARPAGRHAAGHDQRDDRAPASPTRGSASPSTATARSCAASSIASRRRPRADQRRGDRRRVPRTTPATTRTTRCTASTQAGADGSLLTLIGSRARTPAATRWRRRR